MKFHAPFVYKAEVSFDDPNRSDDNLFGRKSTKTKLLMSAVEIEMQSLNDDEAPIVALINETHWNKEDSSFAIRHFDGEFFFAPRERMTLSSISECDLLHLFMPIDTNDFLSTQYAEVFNKWKLLKDRNSETVLGLSPGEEIVTGTINSRKQYHADQLIKKLGQYALIDGELWTRIEEPKISTALNGYSSALPKIEFVTIPDTKIREENKEPLVYDNFNLADWKGVQELYDSHGKEIDSPTNKLTVTVFDTDVFKFDRAKDIAKRVVSTFLRDGQSEMLSKSRTFVMAWLAVREAALEEIGTEEIYDVIDTIKSSLSEMHETSQRKLEPAVEKWLHEVSRREIAQTVGKPSTAMRR